MTALRAAVVGATGYAGQELCRWLLDHPTLSLARVVSRQHLGQPLASVVPALSGLTDLAFEAFDADALAGCDLVFLATPHGAAAEAAAALTRAPLVIDLSADHRHRPGWAYGQVDWLGASLVGAPRIAVPGCFATAISLAAAPFVAGGHARGPVCVAGATGSTGSGATPASGTHHPERFANYKAYKPLAHQHAPEVTAFLRLLGDAPPLRFVPHSLPLDRGILATTFVPIDPDLDATALVHRAYAGAPLVRLRPGSPELRHVRGSAFADLSVCQEEETAVVLSAIDNLGKGAASQAIQCANLALGLAVDAGLRRAAITP